MNWDAVISDMHNANMQATCPHDKVMVDSEEATTRTGTYEERIVQVKVFTCELCGHQWSDDE